MKPTRFQLTPEQKGMLASLLSETGEPVPTLMAAIAEALEELQEHARPGYANGETNSHEAAHPDTMPTQQARKPIWETLIEASLDIPEAELDLLPTDGATQHDHYIYGTPKRPV